MTRQADGPQQSSPDLWSPHSPDPSLEGPSWCSSPRTSTEEGLEPSAATTSEIPACPASSITRRPTPRSRASSGWPLWRRKQDLHEDTITLAPEAFQVPGCGGWKTPHRSSRSQSGRTSGAAWATGLVESLILTISSSWPKARGNARLRALALSLIASASRSAVYSSGVVTKTRFQLAPSRCWTIAAKVATTAAVRDFPVPAGPVQHTSPFSWPFRDVTSQTVRSWASFRPSCMAASISPTLGGGGASPESAGTSDSRNARRFVSGREGPSPLPNHPSKSANWMDMWTLS